MRDAEKYSWGEPYRRRSGERPNPDITWRQLVMIGFVCAALIAAIAG